LVSLLGYRMKGDRMATAGSILSTAPIVLCVLGIAAAGAFYLYKRTRSGDLRARRLAFVERTALDGGRKLLLVRRDDVEHLILIGGPIDLIVETGIRPGDLVSAPEAGSYASPVDVYSVDPATSDPRDYSLSGAKSTVPFEPRLSLSPKVDASKEDTLELTPMLEAKAAP
jgi:hypothetical protein